MIRTTKAARPAAKKASVRKSAPVKQAKADLEAKLAPKPDPTRTKVQAFPGTTLAELRQWAVDRAISTYPAVIGGGDPRPTIKEVVARAETLVDFVLNATVAK